MTLQLLHSEFLHIWGKFDFFISVWTIADYRPDHWAQAESGECWTFLKHFIHKTSTKGLTWLPCQQKLKQYSVHCKWLWHFYKRLPCERENNLKKFLFVSLKTLTNSTVCSKSGIRMYVHAFLLCHWSVFFQCTFHTVCSWLSKQFSESKAACGTIRITGG